VLLPIITLPTKPFGRGHGIQEELTLIIQIYSVCSDVK